MTDDKTSEKPIPVVLPVLPLRNIVVFPGMIVPLFVGREKSIRALEDVMADDKELLLVSQKDGDQDDPQPIDMHEVGTVGSVLQMLKLPDGTVKAKLLKAIDALGYLNIWTMKPFLKQARWRLKTKLATKPS